MKTISLPRLLISGLILSLFASLSLFILSFYFSFNDAFKLCLSLTGLLYLIYLLSLSEVKTGRVSSMLFAIFTLLLMLMIESSNEVLLIVLLGLIFILRAIYLFRNIPAICFDALLIASGVFVGAAVLMSTNSWFLCFWSFFFIQALMVFIPDLLNSKENLNKQLNSASVVCNNQNFKSAAKNAIQAIQQLSIN